MWGWTIPFYSFNELGTLVHEILEDVVMKGTTKVPRRRDRENHKDWNRAYELAERLFPYLPQTRDRGKDAQIVEAEIKFHTEVPGVSVLAYSDHTCLIKGQEGVTDYKTTSHFRWCKTEEELRHDPQCIVYMKYLFSISDADKAFFRHLYTRTKDVPKKVEPHKEVKIWVTREENDKQWQELLRDIQEMQELSVSGVKYTEVEPNYEACRDYAGCPFQKECNAHKASEFFETNKVKEKDTEEAMSSVFERVKAKREAANAKKASLGLGKTTSADPQKGSGIVNPPERPTTDQARQLQTEEMAAKVEQKKRNEETEKAKEKAEAEEAKLKDASEKAAPKNPKASSFDVVHYNKDAGTVDEFLCARIDGLREAGRFVVGVVKGTKGKWTIYHVPA